MLNKHVFFLVQILAAIAASPVSASGLDFCPADDSRGLPGEEHGNSTFRNYCSFIEQPSASCALASHAFASFHVTSSSPGLIYSPPPPRIFSGRGGSVAATMLNKHVFFLVQHGEEQRQKEDAPAGRAGSGGKERGRRKRPDRCYASEEPVGQLATSPELILGRPTNSPASSRYIQGLD
ncbi:hypothetical protein HPB50_021524 [Hyalomma asiaticum]|uniref:Uncharacterized protein n=1 Tax=Hyalomma asiaticum TaxID=266040 RepID=A0ACB7TL77_HYAAI|nr:hypothetical protein HPB50_021524 [Hyalomma asiaticum]